MVSIFNVSSKRQAIKHGIVSSSFKASITSRERNRCETTEGMIRDLASVSVAATTSYAILHYMGRRNQNHYMSNLLKECFGSDFRDTDDNVGKMLRHIIRMAKANILSGQTL